MAVMLKYTEFPCRGCLESLQPNERIKYSSAMWADFGRCQICQKLYCGNPDCGLRLIESRSGDYVPILNPTGQRFSMTCESCGWEHTYLGGQPPVISDPNPPIVSDCCPTHGRLLELRLGREHTMQTNSLQGPVHPQSWKPYGCPVCPFEKWLEA